MPPLTASRIAELLHPFLSGSISAENLPEIVDINQLTSQLEAYLDLLVRWNARTNLTSIR